MNLFTLLLQKKLTARLAPALFSFFIILPGHCLAADTVRINGSGNALDMLKPLVKAYMKTNRDVRIEMERPLGSSGAVKALLAGALDLVASSKQLRPEDAAKGALLRAFGRTPMVVITEKSVPKLDITTKELEEIYSGKTTRWQNGETIRLVLRPREDIDTHILRALSPGMNNSLIAAKSHPGMFVAVTDPETYAAVAETPGGMSSTGLTSIIVEKLPLNVLSLNGVSPTTEHLASGAYPMFKEINFVTTAWVKPAAVKFINFVYSPQGRALAEKSGVLVTGAVNAVK